MNPDAAFLSFFADEFPRRLDAVEIPGMPAASWDRKAAYLLWLAEGNAPLATPAVSDPSTDKDIFS